MNKSQKNSKNSKSEIEKQLFIKKYLEKLTHIQNFFRKIWKNILFFFDIGTNNDAYLFGKRPYDIHDWYEQILKFKSYGIDVLKKIFKWIRRFIVYIIVLLVVLLISINNWLDVFIFIKWFLKELLNPLFAINFFVISFIIVGIFWWFTTPEGHTFGDFLLRAKGIVLRLLTVIIVMSGFYFGISYPPAWFDEAKIMYNMSIASYGEQTWISIPRRISSLHEPLNIRNILIGVFGLVSLIFLWWRNNIADDNLKLEEKRRLDERFHEATETLSKDLNFETYPSHIGGIFTLTQLALDSKELTQKCLDVICSCNEWMKPYVDEFKYGRIDKCYSERELSSERSYSDSKTKNNKKLKNNFNIKNKWENIVSLEEEKRSQKALDAVARILQIISIRESQEDYNFIKLSELNFRSVMLCGINLRRLKLDGINLREACLNGADLRGAALNKANLQYAKFNWANLLITNLEESDLTGAQLRKSILSRTNLIRANMSNAELQGANLSRSKLSGATLSRSNLRFTNMNSSSLFGTNLDYAQLQGANLRWAKLVGSSLYETHLEGANMEYANLQATLFCETLLNGANLSHADISYSIIWKTNLYGTDLRELLMGYYRPAVKKPWVFEDMKNKGQHPLIFSDILLNKYEIKEDTKKGIRDIAKSAPSLEQKKEFMMKMNKAWKLIKNKNRPKELKELKNHSVIKRQGKDGFIIKNSELVIKLQKQWLRWAKSHDVVAERLLLRQKIYFFGEKMEYVNLMNNLVSQYSKVIYKKLKKNTRLTNIVKEIRSDVRHRRIVFY